MCVIIFGVGSTETHSLLIFLSKNPGSTEAEDAFSQRRVRYLLGVADGKDDSESSTPWECSLDKNSLRQKVELTLPQALGGECGSTEIQSDFLPLKDEKLHLVMGL